MSHRTSRTDQRGFAGVVFLVIALIAIVMAAIAAMSRNNSAGSPEQAARTNAAVILKQAADLRTGYDRMLIDGRAAITFNAVGDSGLFSNTTGTIYAVLPTPPATATTVVAPAVPAFTFNPNVTLPGVGPGAADAVFTVGNLTGETCRQINRMLYNDLPTATPASSTATLAAWTTTPAAINDGASTAVNYMTRSEGCIAASGGEFVYYKTAIEN